MPSAPTPRRRWLFRGLYLVYLLLLLGLLELGLWLFAPIPTPKAMVYPPTWLQRSDNPRKGYEPRPGQAGHNSAGFRGPELGLEKRPDTTRVAVIGDSVAWGLGVEAHETYSALLPPLLEQRSGRAWEVVDMGVPGYGTVQIVEHFEEKGLPYQPDIVVYGYWFNDFHQFGCNDFHYPFFSGARVTAWELYVQALLRWPWIEGLRDVLLGSQIALRIVDLRYRWMTRDQRDEAIPDAGFDDPDMARFYVSWSTITEQLSARADVEFLDAFLMNHYGRSAEQSFREYWVALQELRATCNERDIPLILLVTPVLRNPQDYDYQPLHDWVAELGAHLEVQVVDTLPVFQHAGYRARIPPEGGPPDVAHPTPRGHRIIAEALVEPLIGAVPEP